MIVVVGEIEARRGFAPLALAIAGAAAGRARTEIAGVAPDGQAGDRIVLELARLGVGHAALLRTTDRPLEPADLELALRYLPEMRVLVLVGIAHSLIPTAIEGASWSGARLLVVAVESPDVPSVPDDSIVLEAPRVDADATFAGFVADLAVELDRGASPKDAFGRALGSTGAERIGGRATAP